LLYHSLPDIQIGTYLSEIHLIITKLFSMNQYFRVFSSILLILLSLSNVLQAQPQVFQILPQDSQTPVQEPWEALQDPLAVPQKSQKLAQEPQILPQDTRAIPQEPQTLTKKSQTEIDVFCRKPKQLKTWPWRLISRRTGIVIDINKCPVFLKKLEHIKYLDLSNSGIEDLSLLKHLKNLILELRYWIKIQLI